MAIISGTPGNDSLEGTPGKDIIDRNLGRDTVYGRDGNDSIVARDDDIEGDELYGGNGNDTVIGSSGDDWIEGGDGDDFLSGVRTEFTDGGNDTIYGGAGNDRIQGQQGADELYGGAGNDTIFGDGQTVNTGNNDDTIHGDDGDDELYGDAGSDLIYGGADHDKVYGGSGNDTLHGDAGNDSLYGGAANDLIYGGSDRDFLYGGSGLDTLYGGTGPDVFHAEGYATTIADFNATEGVGDNNINNNDFVDLSAFYNATTLAQWNAAHPANQFSTPLAWLRYEQSTGVLTSAGGLRIFSDYNVANDTGNLLSENLLNAENTAVPCFARGTMIATAAGEAPVEFLRVGDMVQTRDNGMQPIRWIGSRKLSASELQAMPSLRPIRIAAGALGSGLPVEDLMVSPQHRILVRSKIAQKMFDAQEVLVAAKQLVLLDGFDIADDIQEVEYFHILFDQHEIVISNGAETESLYTGAEALKSVGTAAAREILSLFPQLADPEYVAVPARFLTSGRQARKMGIRHQQNRHPLVVLHHC